MTFTSRQLTWLAECLRNQGLAVENPPQDIDLPWAKGLAHELVALRYQPRSLAVAPDGTRIAVGTKAGCIHVLSFAAGGWTKRELPDAGASFARGGPPLDAIRSLTFAGNDRLVAGFEMGRFRIFDIVGTHLPIDAEASGGRSFIDQIQEIISLVSDGTPADTGAPVAVAITPGQQPWFLFVRNEIGTSERRPLVEIFPRWRPGNRLVGGTWARGRLWLLADSGWLYSYAGAFDRNARFALVAPPPGGMRFTGMSGNDSGLAIRAGEYVTVVLPEPGTTDALAPDWLHVPGVADVAVIQPFADGAAPSSINPVWLYIAGDGKGLLWVPWFGRGSAQHEPSSDPTLEMTSRPPFRSLAATGPTRVRHVAVGALKTSHAPSPCYLVFATSDEQMGLISFVEMAATSLLLAREFPAAIRSSAKEKLNDPGVTLWLARRCLYDTFEFPAAYTLRPRGRPSRESAVDLPRIDDQDRTLLEFNEETTVPEGWLLRLEAADIDQLTRDLVRMLRLLASEEPDAGRLAKQFERFRRWVIRLLRRASQLDSGSSSSPVSEVAAKLCAGIERYASSEMDMFRIFGEALHKWIALGESFGRMTLSLDQHAEWNWRGGRTIDGAVYASRLLNERVDLVARSSLATPHPNPGIWGLAVSSDGSFTVQSHTDGRITACARDGSAIPWSSLVPDEPLSSEQGGFALQRDDAAEFREHLWYGPLARALVIVELDDLRFLVVFGVRGWPDTGRDKRGPSIHVLQVRRDYATDVAPGGLQSPARLVIEQIASVDHAAAHELFSLHVLERDDECLRALGGTYWGGEQHDASKRAFVELTIDFSSARQLGVRADVPVTSTRTFPRRSVPAPEECNHNPVRSIVCHHEAGRGSSWLFAGQDDGRIRLFLRDRADWKEVEHFGPFALASAVRALAVTAAPARAADEQTILLAFGTGDGTIGVTMVDLTAFENLPASHPAAPPDAIELFIHTRERAEVCGLAFYDEENDDGEPTAARRLMALTRGGVVGIYDVDLFRRKGGRPHRQRIPTPPVEVENHRSLAGARLDHFNLACECRVLAVLEGGGERGPEIIVGGSDGQVRFYALAAPKHTRRRRALAERCWTQAVDFDVKGDPILREAVGSKLLMPWLRLAQVGSLHLVRYSLWVELRQQALEIDGALKEAFERDEVQPLVAAVDRFMDVVDYLADEVFRRRPFSKEPVKIIWEEGAKVANILAEHALVKRKHVPQLTDAFTKLARRLGRLCNQWVGYEQSIESRVLIHSFNAIMNWPSIVFLSSSHEQGDAVFGDARRLITEELIQRRLFFDDLLVPLEAMAAINAALIRAIELRARGVVCSEPHALDMSFFSLIAIVGTLAQRREVQLGTHHPLRTEITRFFALSLLWIPDGVFALAATISECGLTERGRDIGQAVLNQAKRFCAQIERELGCRKLRKSVQSRLTRYADYLNRHGFAYRDDPEAVSHDLSDQRVLPQAQLVWAAAEALRDVLDPSLINEELLQKALDRDDPASDCLAHSRTCLRSLRDHRAELRGILQKARDAFEVDAGRENYERARRICDASERLLFAPRALFEPQRTQYAQIVRAWRDRIQRDQEQAMQMLRLIDRFNRHVYQATADDLAASLQELALRTVPLSFCDALDAEEPGASLRWLIQRSLGGHPVLSDVFERGNRLVEYAHLSGTLLAVAKAAALGMPLEKDGRRPGVAITQIEHRLAQLCKSNGLKLHSNLNMLKSWAAHGSADIWDAILQEWTCNVRKYGVGDNRHFTAHRQLDRGKEALSMWGNRAFADSLSPKWRGKPLRELIDQIDREVGTRYASSDARAGGFGLPLVLRLCRLSGLEAKIELAGPSLGICRSQDDSPLVLTIAWEAR